MPTDPGNLLLLGKINNITIIGVPGCAKSLKRNGFDDVLERVCHGEKFNRKKIAEIACGGLYKNIIRKLKEDKIKMISAIILAAGLSKRMKLGNKLLLKKKYNNYTKDI